jgi:hypothetical protein
MNGIVPLLLSVMDKTQSYFVKVNRQEQNSAQKRSDLMNMMVMFHLFVIRTASIPFISSLVIKVHSTTVMVADYGSTPFR